MIHEQTHETLVPEINEVLTDLLKNLVRNPNAVKVTRTEVSQLVALTIKTDQDDVRRVVGSKGKNFHSLEHIAGAMLKRLDRESHVSIEEARSGIHNAVHNRLPFRHDAADQSQKISKLLKRVAILFAADPTKVSVTSTEVATTLILEVKIPAYDHAALHGDRDAEFGYGKDGIVIGSIKTIFDGLGKNHGRIVRITVTQT